MDIHKLMDVNVQLSLQEWIFTWISTQGCKDIPQWITVKHRYSWVGIRDFVDVILQLSMIFLDILVNIHALLAMNSLTRETPFNNPNNWKLSTWCFHWYSLLIGFVSKVSNKQVTLFPCFTNVKHRKSIVWLFLKINLTTFTLKKRSLQEVSIDMVIDSGIFKINHFTLLPCFTFMPKNGYRTTQGRA